MNTYRAIKVSEPFTTQDELKAIREVLLSGQFVSGRKVKEFEERFANYLGVKHAVAVSSGTAALHIALILLGVKLGDEVIVPPLSFFATIEAVLYQGSVPVFADIDPRSFCLDSQDVERKITKATVAIIPVHLFGNAADMDGIMDVAERYDLAVIEDAAQAHGTEYKGKKVGGIGNMGAFSFYATKHMTTGEGGALVTNDGEWARMARIIRNHGLIDANHHDYLGYNYRMNEMAAAIGIVQLKRLEEMNERRIVNSLYLLGELDKRNLGWLTVPELNTNVRHTFFWCPVLVNGERLGLSATELATKLKKKGIETRHRYHEPLYRQRALGPSYRNTHLKNAEQVAGRLIGLPNHPNLNKDDLDYIVTTLEEL